MRRWMNGGRMGTGFHTAQRYPVRPLSTPLATSPKMISSGFQLSASLSFPELGWRKQRPRTNNVSTRAPINTHCTTARVGAAFSMPTKKDGTSTPASLLTCSLSALKLRRDETNDRKNDYDQRDGQQRFDQAVLSLAGPGAIPPCALMSSLLDLDNALTTSATLDAIVALPRTTFGSPVERFRRAPRPVSQEFGQEKRAPIAERSRL